MEHNLVSEKLSLGLLSLAGYKTNITRKMISSGGASLNSWHQVYSRVFICNHSVVITLVFESLSLLPQYAIGRYV